VPEPISAEEYVSICRLFYQYCRHFDLNEPEGIPPLFTIDAEIDYGPEFPPISGRDSIEASIADGLRHRFTATSHHISNVIVDRVADDRADAVAYVYAWHAYVDGSPDGELWGQYHCALRRSEGQWLIHRMQLRAAGTRDFHRLRMHPIGRRQVD
jgi:hypothetical protein